MTRSISILKSWKRKGRSKQTSTQLIFAQVTKSPINLGTVKKAPQQGKGVFTGQRKSNVAIIIAKSNGGKATVKNATVTKKPNTTAKL